MSISPVSAGSRPFHVVVWGATGFTGKLVCEHIAKDYQGKIRWALAGRDKAKLTKVRTELIKINPDCKDVPILTADALDPAALGEVASQTSVILSTAGPFAKIGDVVVDQCVQKRTHYCDITGEVTWVHDSIAKRSEEAAKHDVSIVHCCGYDSVPSDLGTFMLAQYAREKYGRGITHAVTQVGPVSGGVSGGTVASIANLLESEGRSEMQTAMKDKDYLAKLARPMDSKDSEVAARAPPAPQLQQPRLLPVWNPLTRRYLAPFFMEPVNSKIVYFSNALLKTPYCGAKNGANNTQPIDFQYVEGLGSDSLLGAAAQCSGFYAAAAVVFVGPLRKLLLKTGVLPSPGAGPSEEKRVKGHWRHSLIGVLEPSPAPELPSGAGAETRALGMPLTLIKGQCGDDRDPGYWSTSRMLLETGLSLALTSADEREAAGCRRGGVLTPVAATGPLLLERLRKAGFTFKITGEEEIPAP